MKSIKLNNISYIEGISVGACLAIGLQYLTFLKAKYLSDRLEIAKVLGLITS